MWDTRIWVSHTGVYESHVSEWVTRIWTSHTGMYESHISEWVTPTCMSHTHLSESHVSERVTSACMSHTYLSESHWGVWVTHILVSHESHVSKYETSNVHETPKLSAFVKYSLTYPVHCLLILPTWWAPSGDDTLQHITYTSQIGLMAIFQVNPGYLPGKPRLARCSLNFSSAFLPRDTHS